MGNFLPPERNLSLSRYDPALNEKEGGGANGNRRLGHGLSGTSQEVIL